MWYTVLSRDSLKVIFKCNRCGKKGYTRRCYEKQLKDSKCFECNYKGEDDDETV